MSKSIWDDQRITAYVLGELSGEEKSVFETQCESDPLLAAAVDEARGVTGQLQNLYASESTPPLDAQHRNAIVGGDDKVSLPKSESSWRVATLLLAAAAVLLLLVGVAPWLRQQEPTVAMDDSEELTRPGPQAESESGEPLSQVVPSETFKQEAGTAAASPFFAADSPVAEQFRESSVAASDAEPLALPSRSANAPAGPMAGSGKEPPVSELSLQTAESDRGRGKTRRGRSLGSRDEQSNQPAIASSPVAAQVTDSISYLSEHEGKSPRGEESKNIKPTAAPMDVEFMRADKNVVIRGSKRDMARVEAVIKDVEDKSRPQVAAVNTAAVTPALAASPTAQPASPTAQPASPTAQPASPKSQPASPKSRALGQLRDLQASSAPARGRAIAETVVPESRWRRAVPRLGKIPLIKAESDFDQAIPEGRGPGISGDRFEPITDNPFKRVSEEPLSTFSVDVDTASYSKTRDFLMRANQLPRPDAVRIEELINYFQYDYKAPLPDAEHPFATHVEVTNCPWNTEHLLARIGLKGKTMTADERPSCNLVFLLDTSGSMNASNKLPLVVEGMKMLVDQLTEKDQVAITVYAGSAGLVLDATSAKKAKKIRKALTQLSAGGSTNGGAGIALAYQTARDNFIADGVNRVILCTDGDFNVGVTGTDALVRMVEEEAKGGVFLSVLGFGMGNHNDAMLEKISGRGNGNYAFIDTKNEAHKVLVDQTSATLVTIAKDVKFQIEFNSKHVAQYRLIGYENRLLAKEDFNDDKKDAGEIGAGHAVTALYELVPAGKQADASQPEVDKLKYQTEPQPTAAADSDELMTLKLRYKQPDGDTSTLVEIPVENSSVDFAKASDDLRFAAAVAGFGMQLRRSQYSGTWTFSDIQAVAKSATGEDDYQLRAEFVELVGKASQLMGQE